jgi:hypothetical protein
MMAEIDLIPRDYRNRVVIYGWGTRLSVAMVVFMVLSIAIYVVLNVSNRKLGENVVILQHKQQTLAQGKDALREIVEKKERYQRQWELLKNLRNSTAASKMFVIIDRAISAGDIWFLSWEFQRSSDVVELQPVSANTGYFIVMSDKAGQVEGKAWEIKTRMTIKGQASDHSALSRFVRQLYEQSEVQDVRILNTSLVKTASVVNFDMVVTVNSERVNN